MPRPPRSEPVARKLCGLCKVQPLNWGSELSSHDSAATAQKLPDLRGVLPAGSRLRSYEVIAALGRGNFGITYRAHDETLGRDVAIKEYLPTTLALRGPGATVIPLSAGLAEMFNWGRERFLQEARTLGKLAHVPAVVRVHDFLEANGTAYMVMELVEGETLEHRIARTGALNAEEIEQLLYPLLDGLEQIHSVGFLHRDIKPSNIIVNDKGKPTLIDFGASRAALAGRTTSMTAVFTPGFAPLEQFTSARQGPWTDIYSLSATLFNAITDTSPLNAIDRVVDDAYTSLARLRPAGFPAALLNGIDAGLAVRGSDRPQNIAAWRLIFAGAAVPVSPTAPTQVVSRERDALTPPPVASPLPPPIAVRKPIALYASVAATAVVLAGGAYMVFASRPGPTGVVLQDLTVEDLEKALVERRKAEAAAAEKRRLEEEAQHKVEADVASKKAADAELMQANLRTQKAEEELARLKAEIDARRQQEAGQKTQVDVAAQRSAEEAAQRKAEAAMAEARRAEEEARHQAAAEAEAKRQSEAALAKAQAERQRADDEAATRRQAEEEAAAKQKAEADSKRKMETEAAALAEKKAAEAAERKAAEVAENGLRLTTTDRQRLQVALTSLGFDTRGNDGAFGPRSRQVIADWQKVRSQAATGFLTVTQQQTLLREAAAAVGRFDEAQKKAEDDKRITEEAKRKADDEAKARSAAIAPPVASPPAAVSLSASPDGLWRGTYACTAVSSNTSPQSYTLDLQLKIANGTSSGGGVLPNASNNRTMDIHVSVSPPSVTVTRTSLVGGNNGPSTKNSLTGQFDGTSIRASGRYGVGNTNFSNAYDCTLTLNRVP
jgi:serine/threonine protein kinase/peptidoglycan hydrolase-like protein with peptidoglycan-binding domain